MQINKVKKIKKLILTPEPYPDENFCSYILRLTEANHYSHPNWIYRMAEFKHMSKGLANSNVWSYHSHDFNLLSRLIGVSESKLKEMAYIDVGSEEKGHPIYAFGEELPRVTVQTMKVKFCPLCLKEEPYFRKIWDLVILTTCPIHKCVLIDFCHSCGKQINWMRKSLIYCKCGFDFRETPLQKVEGNDIRLSQLIYEKCYYFPKEYDINPSLKLMNMKEINILIFYIVRRLFYLKNDQRKFPNSSFSNIEIHGIIKYLVSIFDNWPFNFYKFLKELQEKNRCEHGSIQRDFGNLYRFLYEQYKDGKNFDFLRNAFEDYLLIHWKEYFQSNLKLVEVFNQRNFIISGIEAAKFLGVKIKTIKKLINYEIIDGIIRRTGGKTQILILKESIDSFKEKLTNFMSSVETAKILGVSHSTLLDLIRKESIKPFLGPTINEFRYWVFDPERIDCLFQRIDKKIIHQQIEGKKTVSFFKSLEFLSVLGYSTGDFLQLIFDNKINPCGKNCGIGLEQYVFLEREVKDFVNHQKRLLNINTLTIKEVSKLLRVREQCVYTWANKGFISYEVGRSRAKKFNKESVEEFRRKYIISSEIAKNQKTSAVNVVQQLIKNNIMPVSGPTIDGERQYLFLRKDVEEYFS
jgi:predicted site-specific integrase-resolvase